MKLSKHIHLEKGFQNSVNLAYDLDDTDKIASFIPTIASIDLIEEIMLSTVDNSNNRAKILIGAYGKGKSHLVLVLLAMLQNRNINLFERLLKSIQVENLELYNFINEYFKSKKRLLPVIVKGTSSSITQSFLSAMEQALKCEELEDLMPETHFNAVVNMIEKWEKEYPSTYNNLLKLINEPITDFIERVERFDNGAYLIFEGLYPKLTSGGTFNPILGFDVIELYKQVNKSLIKRGYNGMFVVYDEFSKYLESNISNTSISDTRTLQDFAEMCNRSKEEQIHLLLIVHKDISNYIDKLPKQKVDGWRGVSERFKHIELRNNFSQIYEIISSVLDIDKEFFSDYKKQYNHRFEILKKKYVGSYLFNEIAADRVEHLIYHCYPMHPVTTFILPRLSEIVAQNERTLFTFLSSNNKNTLSDFINKEDREFPIITPDFLYDYFEPAIKKEAYTSDIFKAYTIANSIINRIEGHGIAIRLIKTIALIYMVNRFDKLPPTPETIIDIFMVDGVEINEITTTLEELQNKQYVIYMKKSNRYLKLKDSTGSDIRKNIRDYIERNKIFMKPETILETTLKDAYLYPVGYNDEYSLTRFFDFQYMADDMFLVTENWKEKIDNLPGDGLIVGILIRSSENKADVVKKLKNMGSVDRCVFVVPRDEKDIENNIYEYEAIRVLQSEAQGDDALVSEYSIYLDDIGEVLSSFNAIFIEPETRGADYYYKGERQQILRKSQLTHLLSKICFETFPKTPVINNEAIVKNELSTIATSNRNRVVKGLLENEIKPMLGLSGSGQDVSIMRSVLLMTGLIEDIANIPKLNYSSIDDENLQYVINSIDDFILKAGDSKGTSFAKLYDLLTKAEYQIGLKKGLIPIFLAFVLHRYKRQVIIISNGVELNINADLLSSINDVPDMYSIHFENWNQSKTEYIQSLEDLFDKYISTFEKEYNTFTYITRGMQRWFIELPKYSKDIKSIYNGYGEFKKVDRNIIKMQNLLKPNDINSRQLLFVDLPKVLGYEEINSKLCVDIRNIKYFLEEAKEKLIEILAIELKSIFGSKESQASLGSALRDWHEALLVSTKNHLFDGPIASFLSMVKEGHHDERQLVEKIGKIVSGLRIEDWNDSVVLSFRDSIISMKNKIEQYDRESKQNDLTQNTGYIISFKDNLGQEVVKSFDKVEYSKKASFLKNEIQSAINEVGRTITENEKRQILVELLENLC